MVGIIIVWHNRVTNNATFSLHCQQLSCSRMWWFQCRQINIFCAETSKYSEESLKLFSNDIFEQIPVQHFTSMLWIFSRIFCTRKHKISPKIFIQMIILLLPLILVKYWKIWWLQAQFKKALFIDKTICWNLVHSILTTTKSCKWFHLNKNWGLSGAEEHQDNLLSQS